VHARALEIPEVHKCACETLERGCTRVCSHESRVVLMAPAPWKLWQLLEARASASRHVCARWQGSRATAACVQLVHTHMHMHTVCGTYLLSGTHVRSHAHVHMHTYTLPLCLLRLHVSEQGTCLPAGCLACAPPKHQLHCTLPPLLCFLKPLSTSGC